MSGEIKKTSFGERLRSAREGKRLGRPELAEKLGIAVSTLQGWENGKREPQLSAIVNISQLLDVTTNMLIHGDDFSNNLADNQHVIEETPKDEYVYIPVYDIEVSAGHGMFSDGVQHARKHLAFRRRWIKARNLQVDRLAVVFTKGDSMTPTIPENAAIVVDMARNLALDGKVYVIRIDDRLWVKRTQWIPSGGLRLISDNKNYDSFDISKADFAANDVEVIGQVIHAAYDLPD